eukprot:TRINITY_DN26215_c0_g1_i1.p2 TRINITY_DN26215_c0_g1~~TRINITY_DN26215_c0_g1_i1.p2  ORF type:complete len:352 (+),score=112.00 TRINITY_DN26215_c0_g1_i1:69-1124(+)
MESSDSFPEEHDGTTTFHSCWKKKHITRALVRRGWKKELAARGAEACPNGGVCYVQKVNGCKCMADWKLLPKAYVDCIGGKVSLAKMLVRDNLTHLGPRTFFKYSTFCEALDAGVLPTSGSKWYVKVSHMNARRGVSCYPSAEEARRYCETLETDKPAWFRYVIQEEVPRLYLFNGRKMLLRLWSFISVHGGTGDIWLHVNRRLRANAMRSGYDPDSTGRDADVEHCTDNVFESTTDDWDHFESVWDQCFMACHKVVKSMVTLWQKKGIPPPQEEGTGRFNHLAFDFIPSVNPDGSIKPYLLEVNVDPSFCNKCTETAGFAEDVVNFFVEQIGSNQPLVVPDLQFASLQVN